MNHKSTFSDRIRHALARAEMDQDQLEASSGVNGRTLKRYLDRDEPPESGRSVPTVRAVADSLGVTVDWLREGEGEMLAPARGDGARESAPAYDAGKPAPPDGEAGDMRLSLGDAENADEGDLEREGYARIEHVAVEAQGGAGAPVSWEKVDGSTLVPVEWARDQYGAHPDRIKRLRVTGNSMKPTIPPGSHVHVVLLQPDDEPMHGAIYILRGPYGLMVKRLKIESTYEEKDGEEVGKRYIWLWSDNEESGRDRLPEKVFLHDYEPVAVVRRIEAAL